MADNDEKRDYNVEEVWRSYFSTGMPPKYIELPWFENPIIRRLAGNLPSDPRCRICRYPFGGFGGKLARAFLRLEPSKMNPHMCNVCERFADENPGGAEMELALLFADIRGSTPLAASMNVHEFGQLIDRFYLVTTDIIYDHGGMVEKLVGDEVTAFFPPAFAEGKNMARAAVKTGQAILAATGHGRDGEPWVPVGVGIHTGVAYVGTVGEPYKNISIAILGDNVNIAARLAGQAKAGEVVLTDYTYRQADLDLPDLESRSLALKGKEDEVDVWVYRSDAA